MENLPLNMRRPLSMIVYADLYKSVDFLSNKKESFIAWICPQLKTQIVAPGETIYYENDLLQDVYFLKKGSANYVLPKHANQPFLEIMEKTSFGLIDFVAALLS